MTSKKRGDTTSSFIKPRKGWSRYSKPYAPCKPRPPVKNFVDSVSKELGSVEMHVGVTVPLTDFSIPEGVDWSKIYVELNSDYNCWTLTFTTCETIETPNPHYESQMKKHEKDLARWEEEKASHAAELKEWKAWVKQEEEADLEKRLKSAEDLLKKHGRAVG